MSPTSDHPILELVGGEIIELGEGTWMWVDLRHLRFHPCSSKPRAVLSAMIAHPAYAQDYCSPFDPDKRLGEDNETRPVHGRWWLEAITLDRFEQITADRAADVLTAWGQQQDWMADSPWPWREWTATLLDRVRPVLQDGIVFELQNPSAEDEHTYGAVTGAKGFHEFVVIDPAGRVHLVVAADD